MKKILPILIIMTLFISALTAYSKDVERSLRSSVIRLHILADSDNETDQAVKLSVRDEILKAVSDIPASDSERFTAAAQEAANAYLLANGIPYRARAEYGTFEFPRKSYGGITLPAGKYRGVRVILGSGGGHNWWCIMYPPLCVSQDNAYAGRDAHKQLKNDMSSDTYEIITKKPVIKFRIVELLGSVL